MSERKELVMMNLMKKTILISNKDMLNKGKILTYKNILI